MVDGLDGTTAKTEPRPLDCHIIIVLSWEHVIVAAGIALLISVLAAARGALILVLRVL
jgi:hypothetical protein